MIVFNAVTDFDLENETNVFEWIQFVIDQEGFDLGELNYIFSDDDYLLQVNIDFLNHHTLTDIISLDYTVGTLVSGDIYISVDRIKDNAADFNVSFKDELHRVMVHGVLHYCGYKDKTEEEKKLMRSKEDYYLSLRQF